MLKYDKDLLLGLGKGGIDPYTLYDDADKLLNIENWNMAANYGMRGGKNYWRPGLVLGCSATGKWRRIMQ